MEQGQAVHSDCRYRHQQRHHGAESEAELGADLQVREYIHCLVLSVFASYISVFQPIHAGSESMWARRAISSTDSTFPTSRRMTKPPFTLPMPWMKSVRI